MQSPCISNYSSSDPEEVPSSSTVHPAPDAFKITPQDVNILKGYIEEFDQADTQMRSRLLEKAIGEVYLLQPGNSVFNKKEARQVFNQTKNLSMGLLIVIHSRKSESGSTITTLPLIIKLSSLLGGGQPGMPFTMSIRQTSWSLPRNCLEVLPDLRHSWVHSRMQPPNSEMHYPLMNRMAMWRLQRIGQKMHLQRPSKQSKLYIIIPCTPLIILPRMASGVIHGQILWDFQTQMYKMCGVCCIVLIAYEKEDRTPQVSL